MPTLQKKNSPGILILPGTTLYYTIIYIVLINSLRLNSLATHILIYVVVP